MLRRKKIRIEIIYKNKRNDILIIFERNMPKHNIHPNQNRKKEKKQKKTHKITSKVLFSITHNLLETSRRKYKKKL